MVEELVGRMNFGGQERIFQGFGVFGYDKLKEKHIFTWCDNMGTMMMIAEGTADRSGKVITYYSTFPNPMTGKMSEVKSVSTIVSQDGTSNLQRRDATLRAQVCCRKPPSRSQGPRV